MLLYQNNSFKGSFAKFDGAYTTPSDIRVKKNINNHSDVLGRIMKLPIREFHYKEQSDNDVKNPGVIAQELKPIFPSLVKYSPQDDLYSVNYAGLGPIAIKAIQEQQQEIQSLNKQLAEMRTTLITVSQNNEALLQSLGDLSKRVESLALEISNNNRNEATSSSAKK